MSLSAKPIDSAPLKKCERIFISAYLLVISLGLFGVNCWPLFNYSLFSAVRSVGHVASYRVVVVGEGYNELLEVRHWNRARRLSLTLKHAISQGIDGAVFATHIDRFRRSARRQCGSCRELVIEKSITEWSGKRYELKTTPVYRALL